MRRISLILLAMLVVVFFLSNCVISINSTDHSNNSELKVDVISSFVAYAGNPLLFVLDIKSTYDIKNIKWDFDGDGFIDLSGTDTTAEYVYKDPGNYTLKVIVSDVKGNDIKVEKPVKILEPEKVEKAPVSFSFDLPRDSVIKREELSFEMINTSTVKEGEVSNAVVISYQTVVVNYKGTFLAAVPLFSSNLLNGLDVSVGNEIRRISIKAGDTVNKVSFNATSIAYSLILINPAFMGTDISERIAILEKVKSDPEFSRLVELIEDDLKNGESIAEDDTLLARVRDFTDKFLTSLGFPESKKSIEMNDGIRAISVPKPGNYPWNDGDPYVANEEGSYVVYNPTAANWAVAVLDADSSSLLNDSYQDYMILAREFEWFQAPPGLSKDIPYKKFSDIDTDRVYFYIAKFKFPDDMKSELPVWTWYLPGAVNLVDAGLKIIDLVFSISDLIKYDKISDAMKMADIDWPDWHERIETMFDITKKVLAGEMNKEEAIKELLDVTVDFLTDNGDEIVNILYFISPMGSKLEDMLCNLSLLLTDFEPVIKIIKIIWKAPDKIAFYFDLFDPPNGLGMKVQRLGSNKLTYIPEVKLKVVNVDEMCAVFTVDSTDTDGYIVKYEWDFDGNGVFDKITGPDTINVEHCYAKAGTYKVSVKAIDNDSSWEEDSLNLHIKGKNDIALLVYDKANLNSYDRGFIGVLDSLGFEYDIVDFNEVEDGIVDLSKYKVVISNIMGLNPTVDYADGIISNIQKALENGVDFILGSESVIILGELGLADVSNDHGWWPALNDTIAVVSVPFKSPITKDVSILPNWQDYLGKDGELLSSYFGDGVYWKVMSDYSGYRTIGIPKGYPVYFFEVITSGWEISERPFYSVLVQYIVNNGRILYLGDRFWTTDNESKHEGWIGPEGKKVLLNAINYYINTNIVGIKPSKVVIEKIEKDDGSITLTWDGVSGADRYEIWRAEEGSDYRLIGIVVDNGLSSYTYEDKDLDSSKTYSYVIRAISGDVPGEFSDVVSEEPGGEEGEYVLIEDDFEEYEVGSEPNVPWGRYDHDGGSYAQISSVGNPEKSIEFVDPNVDGWASVWKSFAGFRKGILEFDIRLDDPSGAVGVRLWDTDSLYIGPFVGIMYFGDDGKIYLHTMSDDWEFVKLKEAEVGKWYRVKIVFDLSSSNYYDIYINGEKVQQGYSPASVLNYFHMLVYSDSVCQKAYIDNVKLTVLDSGYSPDKTSSSGRFKMEKLLLERLIMR